MNDLAKKIAEAKHSLALLIGYAGQPAAVHILMKWPDITDLVVKMMAGEKVMTELEKDLFTIICKPVRYITEGLAERSENQNIIQLVNEVPTSGDPIDVKRDLIRLANLAISDINKNSFNKQEYIKELVHD